MAWILSCIGCGTKKLPQTEEIEVLDFQHYSLATVPPYVFECERFLEELYLDYNQITELPKELFLCHELQILSLSDNDLHHIPPAISSLSNLTSLDISKNGITDIPDSIKSCKRLRCVNASINPLCKLPEGFTQLVALRELSLSDTFLEYLPANFGRLSGLEVLELRENQLNTLPRSMTRLTALKRLDLGQNEFTELPEVIGHLTSLVDLWIDSNRIKRLPAELGNLSRLSFLDVTKNRLREIDPQIGNCKSLSDLYLTRNDLEELPDSLCQCTKLTYLHIDDNHLEHLPDKLGSLDSLLELKVSKNELSALPNSVGLLRNLQFLHADENVLCSLPGDVGSCVSLVVITASHNRIRELPAEMGSLSALRVLNLCGNAIQSLPVSFTKLQLTALWLSENQAKPSVPLQRMTDESGQKVLTCFMLPQSLTQSPVLPTRADEDRPLTEAEIEARRARSSIHFATDGEQKPPSRLSRTPTPYPKELRALAKHTKNILAWGLVIAYLSGCIRGNFDCVSNPCRFLASMYPQSQESAGTSVAPTISVTVTALARPTSFPTNISPAPSPPNTSGAVLDTPTITNIVFSALEGVQSGVPTRTTPTLTPTTLKNIEHFFGVPSVQPPEVHFNQAGFVPPPVQLTTGTSTFVSVDSKGWGGGVTTLTQPPSVSPSPSPSSRAPSTTPPAATSNPMPSLSGPDTSQAQPGKRTGGRRPMKDEKLSPEEEERRLLRRERNKQAAARCRKRRLDQTNRLQDETDALEDRRESLQQEIQQLQQQREELEFLLAAHTTNCKRSPSTLQFNSVEVKKEPTDPLEDSLDKLGVSTSSHHKPPRPTSLALGNRCNRDGPPDLGIVIETPSNELRSLGFSFESMMNSGTGLTPVNPVVAAPISTGLTPLTTPVVTTAPSSNCGTQQRSSSSELSSPDSVPPKLVSL